MIRFFVAVLSIVGALIVTGESRSRATTPESGESVAATVGDVPISVDEAQRLFSSIVGDKKWSDDAIAHGRAQVLEEIVNRQLVLAYAARKGDAPSDTELKAAMDRFGAQLAAKHTTLADFLKSSSMTESMFQRQLIWNRVWTKYLAQYQAPERRTAYFAAHRRDLDGTELVVSHILLRPAAGAGAGATDALVKQATTIRDEITTGKITFADAAKKYSGGPSRDKGGHLGAIGRHGPMDEAFSKAAFLLQVGEISPPVVSPFGVHLIRCDEVRPGKKQLSDARHEIDDALARELLDKLAQVERGHTVVKYTAAWPHFKPGTKELDK